MDSPRTSYISSPLVRQLARLADAQSLSRKEDLPNLQNMPEALSRWLGWTDAISLSFALNGANDAPAGFSGRSAVEDIERVKAGLKAAIAEACASTDSARSASLTLTARRPLAPPREPAPPAAPDYATWRQRYQSVQQAMEQRVDQLRQRLRAKLAASSLQGARLAAVDGVMEQVLASREKLLLHGISTQRLERRFEHLQSSGDAGWLDTFRKDMHAVLLAELDTRMQVVEGLFAALQSAPVSR